MTGLPLSTDLAGLRRRIAALAAAVGLSAGAAGVVTESASAVPGTPQYPNVRALPPTDIHLGRETVDFQQHYVIRFSTYMYNQGPGRLELHGVPHVPPDGTFDASQWIYEDPAGLTIEPVGTFAFHPQHQHFHFDGYGRYELWTKRAYDRAAASNFTQGSPSYVAAKVSFCMLDIAPVDPHPPPPEYQTCTPVMEGVTPGWADVYDWTLPDQWIDVGLNRLPDGDYVIRNIADPDNLIWESPGKADPSRESQVANSGATVIHIVNGQLAG